MMTKFKISSWKVNEKEWEKKKSHNKLLVKGFLFSSNHNKYKGKMRPISHLCVHNLKAGNDERS